MTDRRSFLKLFGAGAVVAPVIGGIASPTGATARLIEEPKVEIIPPPKLIAADHIPDMNGGDIVVFCQHQDGRRFVLEASYACITSECKPIIQPNYRTGVYETIGTTPWRHRVDLRSNAEWRQIS